MPSISLAGVRKGLQLLEGRDLCDQHLQPQHRRARQRGPEPRERRRNAFFQVSFCSKICVFEMSIADRDVHFPCCSPVAKMPLVEVIRGKHTSERAVSTL